MEELIILLIRGIGWLFGDRGKTKPPPPTSAWPAAWPAPPKQIVPAPTQGIRRPKGAPLPKGGDPPPLRRQSTPGRLPSIAVAAPILTRPQATPVASPRQPVAATAGRRPAAAVASKLSPAADLRRQLTPATLRRQVVLSEILEPPIALRPDPYGL